MDGTSLGTLSSARRSPYWRLPSISAVDAPSWAMLTARLKAIVVLPTPPLGAKTETTRQAPAALAWRSARTWLKVFTSSKPLNGSVRTASMPRAGSRAMRMLGNGQDHGGNIQTGIAKLLDQLRALELALEQQVDHHDIRPELPRRLERPSSRR